MRPLIVRTTVALLCIELGSLLQQRITTHRTNIQAFVPHADPVTGARTMRALLVLGEDDCTAAVAFIEGFEALAFEHPRLSQQILVAGSDSARQRVRLAAANRSTTVNVESVSFTQLRTLGIKPARHIGRLMLLDSRGQIVLLTLVPTTARELAAIASLASSVVHREVERK